MPKVFIGVGSNLGDRAGYLEFAKRELFLTVGAKVLECSPVYETEPVAAEGGPFLNAVWSFETDLLPQDLLRKMHEIEEQARRERKSPNEARTLDLDILFYGEQVIREPGLTVPHPSLHERAFVLIPLCDLEPEFIHPVLEMTAKELLNNLGVTNNVQRSVKSPALRVGRCSLRKKS